MQYQVFLRDNCWMLRTVFWGGREGIVKSSVSMSHLLLLMSTQSTLLILMRGTFVLQYTERGLIQLCIVFLIRNLINDLGWHNNIIVIISESSITSSTFEVHQNCCYEVQNKTNQNFPTCNTQDQVTSHSVTKMNLVKQMWFFFIPEWTCSSRRGVEGPEQHLL